MDALRDDLVRALNAGASFRAAEGEGDDFLSAVLFGVFARFNEWTEISSWYEGNFLERIDPGSFKKTIAENRDAVKILFDHGFDPSIGNKVLGPIDVLEEKGDGCHYESPLFDTAYNRDLLPGLRAGVYGASFRFRVIKDEWNDEPGTSDHNPVGLPERTIKEVRLFEFGPVTFPAYLGATAAARSMTDEYLARRYATRPDALKRLAEVAADLRTRDPQGGEPRNTPSSEPPAALGMTHHERRRLLQINGVNP